MCFITNGETHFFKTLPAYLVGSDLERQRLEKRMMIKELKTDYPVKVICETLGIARSTYYGKPGDKELLNAIEKIIMKRPTYGYRRITHDKGHMVGETRVRRLLKQLEHSCSVGKASISTTNSQHGHPRYPNLIKGLKISRLNQV